MILQCMMAERRKHLPQGYTPGKPPTKKKGNNNNEKINTPRRSLTFRGVSIYVGQKRLP